VIFIAGGDQQKISSKLGGTPLCDLLRDLFLGGATIAGTSSGASVLSETMLVSGETDESHHIGGSLRMAPGLGLIGEVIIDQHFAERGRMSRLIGAVAQNPRMLGLGIDEDTAAILDREKLRVMGSGAVYVVDGREMTFSNAGSDDAEILSAFNVRVHMLSRKDEFSFDRRIPVYVPSPDPEPVGAK
jgi:cyanophycinase